MSRLALALAALLPGLAAAESAWLTARGRATPQALVAAWGTLGAAGLSLSVPDGQGAGVSPSATLPTASVVGDVGYHFLDRVAELRLARLWQLTAPRLFTLSASLGGAAFLVPEGRTDVGLGPHASVALGLGGQHLSADVAFQAGSELFVQGGVRFPLRTVLTLSGRYRQLTLSLAGRAGVDLSPGHFFRARAEALVLVGWFAPW